MNTFNMDKNCNQFFKKVVDEIYDNKSYFFYFCSYSKFYNPIKFKTFNDSFLLCCIKSNIKCVRVDIGQSISYFIDCDSSNIYLRRQLKGLDKEKRLQYVVD